MTTINCVVCGVSVRMKPSHAAKRHHCSMGCYRVAQRANRDAFFWSKVNKTDDCWLWTGSVGEDGYGKVMLLGKTLRAHRVAYDLTHDVPLGTLYACHECDNPLCVRPDHIFPGTAKDNFDDSYRKGRTIHQIKQMHYYQNENYLTGKEAAELAGVSRRTIYRWANEGRIRTPFTRAEIIKQEKRQRGPQRDPFAKRYTEGRHNPAGRNWQKASG